LSQPAEELGMGKWWQQTRSVESMTPKNWCRTKSACKIVGVEQNPLANCWGRTRSDSRNAKKENHSIGELLEPNKILLQEVGVAQNLHAKLLGTQRIRLQKCLENGWA